LKERFEDGWMEARINPSILKERFDGWMDGCMDGNSIFFTMQKHNLQKSL